MGQALWLYYRFNLSHRDTEDLLAERGIIQINGTQHYLWRAVDQDGEVVDVYLQAKRDGAAAKRFFRPLLRSHGEGASDAQVQISWAGSEIFGCPCCGK